MRIRDMLLQVVGTEGTNRGALPAVQFTNAFANEERTQEFLDQLLPLCYGELRHIARRELSARPSDSLSATELVHELYLKLSRAGQGEWRDRAHFLGVAAVAMRRIIVDHARRQISEKRGGEYAIVELDDALATGEGDAELLLELHEALDHLARLNARLARVVECRFFGGLTEQETAKALDVDERTVRRDWVKARALLHRVLAPDRMERPV